MAVGVAAPLVPAAPASAQTATPTPAATFTVPPIETQPVRRSTVSRSLIDLGETVDATVLGTPGTQVALFLGNVRAPRGRQIRTGTTGSDGTSTRAGLRPVDPASAPTTPSRGP